MKTLVTLLKIAMLVTTLSSVMSCDKNNKRSNNTTTAYGNQIYTYGANGTCINNQTGQQVQPQLCQQQYQGGYGQSVQCTGSMNGISYFIFVRGQQNFCSGDNRSYSDFSQYGGCWVSCNSINCSGQQACQGGGVQTGGQIVSQQCGYTMPVQCL